MKITDMFQKTFIIEELGAKNKREVLTELSGIFLKAHMNLDNEAMLNSLLEKERLGGTSIGDGIAMPHGKLKGLKNLILSFGRSREGIDFNALDGKPVHLFFLLMSPESNMVNI